MIILNRSKILFLLSIACFTFLLSCQTKKKDDNTALVALLALASNSRTTSSLALPSMETLVQDTLPLTLKNTAYSASTRSTSVVQTRFFQAGPSDFRFRLKSVDTDGREMLRSSPSSCFTPAANNYTSLNVIPTGNTSFSFPMTLTCVRNLTLSGTITSSRIYVGRDTTHYYLARIQVSSSNDLPTIAVFAKINLAATEMEVHQISKDALNFNSWVHILANKTTSSFEISNGSDLQTSSGTNTNFTGVGCGVQMKTTSALAYASGSFAQQVSCPASTTSCSTATGTSLTDATGQCTGAITTFNTLNLTQANVGAINIKTMLNNIFTYTGFPTAITTVQ